MTEYRYYAQLKTFCYKSFLPYERRATAERLVEEFSKYARVPSRTPEMLKAAQHIITNQEATIVEAYNNASPVYTDEDSYELSKLWVDWEVYDKLGESAKHVWVCRVCKKELAKGQFNCCGERFFDHRVETPSCKQCLRARVGPGKKEILHDLCTNCMFIKDCEVSSRREQKRPHGKRLRALGR